MLKEIKYKDAIQNLITGDGNVIIYEKVLHPAYLTVESLRLLSETGKFFIEAEEEPVQERHLYQEAKPVKSSRKTVDHGKVMALHNAGWNASKIADEMGCTIGCIYNHLDREGVKNGK